MPDCLRLARGLVAVAVLLAVSLGGLSSPAVAADRPNVIVFLTDDQGWMDSGVYGSRYYDTPNFDRLAASGVRFTNAYSASPLCSPTRLSVLTGKYPHRLGMTAPHGHLPTIDPDTPLYEPGKTGAAWQAYLVPESKRQLLNDADTYGKAFKAAGYATAFMGKWHLGKPPYMPENQGYDVVIGGRGNPGPPGGFFAPWNSDTLPKRPAGTHIDDAITDEALAFIDASVQQGKPFLLDLWFYDVHAPFQAKQPLIQKYRQRTDPRGFQDLAIMGAMLETFDTNLGRVLDHLEQHDLADKTVIVFWSDNGGNMYDTVEGTTPTNNAPLKAGKGNIHEGGIRVPAVIRWPGVTRAGTVSDAVVSTIDIYPTILEMAGLDKPASAQFDGLSLGGLLRGQDLDRDTMFFHFPHYVPKPKNMSASAVRRGDYKLIRRYDRDGDEPYKFELYNLAQDIGETDNLADRQPEMVRELDAAIRQHLEDTDTPVPPANPNYNPTAFNPITNEGQRPAPAAAAQEDADPALQGWLANPNSTLSLEDGALVLECTTKDPGLRNQQVPAATGPLQLKLRLKQQTGGRGQVFWSSSQQRGFAGSSVNFDLQHDDQWQDYTLDLPVQGSLMALRIDPGQAPGRVAIASIELLDGEGQSLQRWDFADAEPGDPEAPEEPQ